MDVSNDETSRLLGKWSTALLWCATVVFVSACASGQQTAQVNGTSKPQIPEKVAPPNPASSASTEFKKNLEAAQAGDVQAQLKVAKAYFQGSAVERNSPQAAYWFQAAADKGSVEAAAWLGNCYVNGLGVPKDLVYGRTLIEKAANQKDPTGLRLLGTMYQEGVAVPQDYGKAFHLLAKAADLKEPSSFDRLGYLYLRGLGMDAPD